MTRRAVQRSQIISRDAHTDHPPLLTTPGYPRNMGPNFRRTSPWGPIFPAKPFFELAS